MIQRTSLVTLTSSVSLLLLAVVLASDLALLLAGGTHGGYLPANYVVTAHECGLSADEVVVLARNSLESSFASPKEKEVHIAALRAYVENFATTTFDFL